MDMIITVTLVTIAFVMGVFTGLLCAALRHPEVPHDTAGLASFPAQQQMGSIRHELNARELHAHESRK